MPSLFTCICLYYTVLLTVSSFSSNASSAYVWNVVVHSSPTNTSIFVWLFWTLMSWAKWGKRMFASLNIKKKKKKFPVFSFFFSIFPPLINHLENRLFFYLSHCCYNLCATLIQGVLWPTYGVTECFEGQGEEEFLCEILVINYWIIPISQGELRSVNGLLHLLQGFLCCQV